MSNLNIRVAFSAIDKFTRPVSAARQSAGGLTESIKKTQASIKSLDQQSATFQKLRASTNDTARKLTTAQRAAAGLSQRLAETGTLTDAQRARLDMLRGKISTLTTAYTAQTAKLRESGSALRQHGITLTSGSGTIQSAIRRTEQYNKTLERERQQLAAVTRARTNYDKAQQTAGKLKAGGTGAVVGAVAAGYAGGRFLAPAIGFDEEMSRVQALTRLDKSSEQLAALRAQAKKLGAETAFTTRDAASGQAFLAMAGFTPEAIQAALPGVLNMALAGGMELGESADIGSNVQTQFGMNPDQMDRISDTLTAAFTRTNTDLRQLGETMTYAGPVAAKLGIDLETAAGMAGMLANSGLRGSQAGTALRASLARLASPPKKAADALAEMGVSVADANGKMKPMEQLLLDMYNATKKYGEVDQVSFFKDIAGEEAFVGLQTLVQSAGSGALQKLIGELKTSGGEAQAVAKKMADNLGGDLKELDSAWEGLRIQFEETADGALRKLTQGLSSVIGRVSAWSREHPKLTQGLIIATGGVIALAGAMGGLSLVAGVLMGPLAKLRLGFALLTSSAAAGFSGLAATATTAFSAITGSASLLLGPIGLIGLAIVAAGALIWRYWEPIKAFFAGFFNGVAQGIEPLRTAFAPLAPLFNTIGSAIGRVWNWFKSLFEPVNASKAALDACSSAGETFGRVLGAAFSALMLPLQALMKGIGWILEKLGLIPGGIDAAQKKADTLRAREPVAWEWDPEQKKMVQREWKWAPAEKQKVTKIASASEASAPTITAGTLRRGNSGSDANGRNLKKIADNTGGLLNEEKKRIGPGDIVFKNLPKAEAIRGAWQEPRVIAQQLPRITPVVVREAERAPVLNAAQVIKTEPSARTFAPHIEINIHDAGTRDARELAQLVAMAVRDEMSKLQRAGRSSFLDHD